MSTQTFGQWLERQLNLREWSAADFTRRMGTGSSIVSMWLRDARLPSTGSCRRIADALNLDEEVVLVAAGHLQPPEPVDPNSLETMIVGLARQIDWTEEDAALVGGIMRQYIDRQRRHRGESR